MATKKITNTTNSDVIKITSLSDLSRYQEGEVVELPPFGPDMPFVVKLKRPSILSLAKSGKIPNTLMEAADALFSGRQTDKKFKTSQKTLVDTCEVIEILCEAAFVSPSWEDIKQSGIELTDEQFVAVFNYVQR